MSISDQDLKQVARTVAMFSVDAIEKANSGHPGLPMGAALYTSLLWSDYLRFNPAEPNWIGRDRFVLSAGHGSMLLYSLLNLFRYDLSLKDLSSFRQWGSRTPGHPEYGMTPGVEATTGPLGQGAANCVGMALSGKLLGAKYDAELFNYRVFGLVSDGDLMEGVAAEAASLAGHLKLGNLVYLYDDNKITLAGTTDVCFTESVNQRYESYGWQVQSVNSDDIGGLRAALDSAISETTRPSLISIRSIIGEGSPNKADSFKVHGSPLGAEETKLTKQALGWPEEPTFYHPPEVGKACQISLDSKIKYFNSWQSKFESWKKKNGELSEQLDQQLSLHIPTELGELLERELKSSKPVATRESSGAAIQVVAEAVPFLVGGSADLESSTKTTIKSSGEIQAGEFTGRNIRYGVREHAMGAIANGLAYEGCWIPLTSTFLVFSDYMRPSIRLAALSHLQSIYVFTHDSVWVGEDGPTHEPIEQTQSLRLIPNLKVYRPADGPEMAASYMAALNNKKGPSAIICSRQAIKPIERDSNISSTEIAKGGYVVKENNNPQAVTLVATGSELPLAVEVHGKLTEHSIACRVVSMLCVEEFRSQDESYQQAVLPAEPLKFSIELGATMGWRDILGDNSHTIGLDHYGASAPGGEIVERLGFTAEKLTDTILSKLQK